MLPVNFFLQYVRMTISFCFGGFEKRMHFFPPSSAFFCFSPVRHFKVSEFFEKMQVENKGLITTKTVHFHLLF
jgi:hypothetical protein